MSEAVIGIIATVAGTAICAMAQLSGKVATLYISPVVMCLIRYSLCIPMCWATMYFMTGKTTPGMSWETAAYSALIAVIAWGFGAVTFFTTMKKDSMHRVAPVSNSLSVWAAVLSILFLGEPFFPALAVVLLILVAGIALMAPAGEGTKRWRWGIPAAMAVSLLWAISVVMTKTVIHDTGYIEFVFVKMIGASAFHAGAVFFEKREFQMRGMKFIVLSSITLVAGDTLLMVGIDKMPASIFSPVFATVIPFGFIGSVLFLGEKPVSRNWIGMALIFLAAAICGYFGAR